MRNCSSALNLSVVCILTRNCTEGSGVCLDRMRDCFRFVNKWSSGDIGNIVSFSIIFFSRTTEAMVWKRDLYVHFKVLDRSCYFLRPSEIQNRCQRRSKFALKSYVKQHFHGLLEKH